MSLKVNIEKYFKPDVYLDDVVRTSSTVGHLKNDGTVDTTSYATSASVSAITDGQSIDSFSDVETALAGKAENSVVGTVENGTTASQAYAVGEHFIRNDKFCTVIAAIASGATLTLNTNYVEGTIAENITKRVNYSATEHVIGTWINGETLYEKTINFGALPNTGFKQVSLNIANAKRVWIHEGYAYNPNNGIVNLLSLINPPVGLQSGWAFYIINDKIECVTGSDRTAYTECYVTVRYTKTTD